MTTLHITNGDSAADLITASSIAGEVLPWRDPMHHGPFPANMDLAQLSATRAHYLAGPGISHDETRRAFQHRDDRLRNALTHDRIVLWFEHDLLDQLQLLQLLDWFAHEAVHQTKLELICINEYPQITPFRGLGQLNPVQIASIFGQRLPVKDDQLTLAIDGWSAFRSPDPRDLVSYISRNLSPLPFLRAALSRHLEEYPDAETGLSRTEHQILTLVANGVSRPGQIFARNMDLETALFIGDWSTYRHIDTLCTCDPALLTCDDEPFWYPPRTHGNRDAFLAQRLRLTAAGQQVLSGQRDAFDCLLRDQWLGGVHLQSGHLTWTWDSKKTRLRVGRP